MSTHEIITRKEAQSQGLRRYFTGKPCKGGHTAERLVSTKTCVDCQRDITARWRVTNPEKPRARKARYQSDNAEYRRKSRERAARWRVENPEQQARYRSEHPEKVREHEASRRARKLNATPEWDAELTELATAEACDLAKRREAVTGFTWHVDHMIPLRARNACGLHTASNLQVIPARLNLSKHNRLWLTQPGEWIKHA